MTRIALVGDPDLSVTAHRAIPLALELSARTCGATVESCWFPTASLKGDASESLAGCHGVWCVPGSPYANMEGALAAIRFARERRVPFLGTCGGFQHALIEYARNVLGLGAADHAESNPLASLALITPLICGLTEVNATTRFLPGTKAFAWMGRAEVEATFNCCFGFNEAHRALIASGPLQVSGVGEADEVRVIELADHPFFVATLFQPERAALRDEAHPLITAFVRAAAF